MSRGLRQMFYFVAARPGAGLPDIVKAIHDRMFHEPRDAREFAEEKSLEYGCPLGVYEAEARVIGEVIVREVES